MCQLCLSKAERERKKGDAKQKVLRCNFLPIRVVKKLTFFPEQQQIFYLNIGTHTILYCSHLNNKE